MGRGAGFASKLTTLDPFAIEDVEAEPEASAWRQAGRVAGFRAMVATPLFASDGEPLGIIVAAFHGPYRMGDRQARLVDLYAGQAAEAIESAQTLERLERSDRRKGEAIAGMDVPLTEILAALDSPNSPDPDATREAVERQVRRLQRLIHLD